MRRFGGESVDIGSRLSGILTIGKSVAMQHRDVGVDAECWRRRGRLAPSGVGDRIVHTLSARIANVDGRVGRIAV